VIKNGAVCRVVYVHNSVWTRWSSTLTDIRVRSPPCSTSTGLDSFTSSRRCVSCPSLTTSSTGVLMNSTLSHAANTDTTSARYRRNYHGSSQFAVFSANSFAGFTRKSVVNIWNKSYDMIRHDCSGKNTRCIFSLWHRKYWR